MKVYVVYRYIDGLIMHDEVRFVTSKLNVAKEYCYENNRISMYTYEAYKYYYKEFPVEDDIEVPDYTDKMNVHIIARSCFDVRYEPTKEECHGIKKYGKDEFAYYDCVIPMIPNESQEKFNIRFETIKYKMIKEFKKNETKSNG